MINFISFNLVEATRFELATPCSLVLETRFELAIFSTIPFCHSNKTSALPTALRLEICGRVINQFIVQVLLFSNFPRLKFVPQKRMVRVAGFEPARYFYRKILSLLRTACFATPAYLIKSIKNFLFPFNMIIITYNHQIVKALIKLSFYFSLKFLFRCVPKTVKMVHSLPFNFIVGKVSFGNILRTLSKQGR